VPRVRRPLLALLVIGVLLAGGYLVSGPRGSPPAGPGTAGTSATPSASVDAASGLALVPASALPEQARTTLGLVAAGGPYPYTRDGAVFGNLERRLPRRDRDYYREYTVPTPGESDRGARRIVAGEGGELYYTADHYGSFVRVDPDR